LCGHIVVFGEVVSDQLINARRLAPPRSDKSAAEHRGCQCGSGRDQCSIRCQRGTDRVARVTAIVTGGGSGIGSAVVDRLRVAGNDVVVWDLKGGDIVCDISDPDAVVSAIGKTLADHGLPDRLVACAGIGASGLLLDQPPEDWRRVIDTNLTGTWLTMRAVARAMIEAGTGGSIVAVSSISGTIADREMGAYCVSKAGVDMLVRVAATEWGAHGIRVNAVAPGVTRTPMLAQAEQLPGWVEGLTERTALGRLGEADDVAEVIVSVLEMSWVTGQTVCADGGLALHSPIDAYGQMQRLKR
jgi:NAD(P)-dependent dehydrogenase (short-subunit alcohol dehydrogenase family)